MGKYLFVVGIIKCLFNRNEYIMKFVNVESFVFLGAREQKSNI